MSLEVCSCYDHIRMRVVYIMHLYYYHHSKLEGALGFTLHLL